MQALAFLVLAACGTRTPLALGPSEARGAADSADASTPDGAPASPPNDPPPPVPSNPAPDGCDSRWLGSALGELVASGILEDTPNASRLEPECGGSGRELTFVWEAPSSGVFVFDTQGSSYDTTLALLRGEDCDGPELTCDDDGAGGTGSRVEWALSAGERVVIVLDDLLGVSSGSYALAIRRLGSDPCPDIVSDATPGEIVLRTDLGTIETQRFSNECNGSGAATSVQWTAPYDGVFVFDTVGSDFDTVLSMFTSCDGELLTCDDDTFDLQSQIGARFREGQTALLVVHAFGGGRGGTFQINVSEDPGF